MPLNDLQNYGTMNVGRYKEIGRDGTGSSLESVLGRLDHGSDPPGIFVNFVLSAVRKYLARPVRHSRGRKKAGKPGM